MSPSTFNQPHSLAIRIWHWTFFVCIAATLVTVLLASTFFRTRNTISMVQEQLQQKGVVVNQDQARAVAHEYNDKLWDIHRVIGYVLSALLLSRFLIELAQPREEKLIPRLKIAMGHRPEVAEGQGQREHYAEEQARRRHFVSVKTSYLIFYLIFLLMALTGLVLAFEDVAFLKGVHNLAKQVHSFLQYLIYVFILIHLIGVTRADLGRDPGLVSGMIHGKKRT
jgi:cytochrome b561